MMPRRTHWRVTVSVKLLRDLVDDAKALHADLNHRKLMTYNHQRQGPKPTHLDGE